MEIEELFRVLKPVLGERLRELWLEYRLNPESRREIEGLLHVLAAQHLGRDFDRQHTLLPPPAMHVAAGEYPLGTVLYGSKELYPFGLREQEWIQHASIFGRTGSGKTNVGLLIVKQLLEKAKPFLIFDWKRNYRDMLAWPETASVRLFTVGRETVPFRFNPLMPPKGTSPSIWLKKLIEILMHVYWLGEGVAYLLQRAIDAVYVAKGIHRDSASVPTFEDVQTWLRQYKAKGREAQWMDSTLRVIGTLCYGNIGDVVNVTQQTPVDELLRQQVILELDALTNSDKTFLIETLLLWIHHYRLQEPTREQFKHAILIEEAHHVLLRKRESKESIPDIILREIRELGESVIIIDQHPSLVSIPSLGNTYCTIAMNLKHARDVATISDAILLEHRDREYIGKLEVGTGIVRVQGRHSSPFLVQFPLVDIVKGSVTDDWLKERTASDSGGSAQIQPLEAPRPEIQPVQPPDKVGGREEGLGDDERRMLIDVMEHPATGIRSRFARLSLSAARGERVLEMLAARSYVSSSLVSTGRGRVRFLQLTEKAAAALRAMGHEVVMGRAGGPVHEYWKHRLAEHFRSKGYEVEMEKPVGGGCTVDLVASRDGELVAIEVETGASDVARNVEKCLAADFQSVVSFDAGASIEPLLRQRFTKEVETGQVAVWTWRTIEQA